MNGAGQASGAIRRRERRLGGGHTAVDRCGARRTARGPTGTEPSCGGTLDLPAPGADDRRGSRATGVRGEAQVPNPLAIAVGSSNNTLALMLAAERPDEVDSAITSAADSGPASSQERTGWAATPGAGVKRSVPRDPVGDRKPGLIISWVRYPYDHHENVLEISPRLRPHRTPGAAQLENDEHAGLNLHGSPV